MGCTPFLAVSIDEAAVAVLVAVVAVCSVDGRDVLVSNTFVADEAEPFRPPIGMRVGNETFRGRLSSMKGLSTVVGVVRLPRRPVA